MVRPLLILSIAIAAGCGSEKNCPNTCAHIFDESQCGVTYPGFRGADGRERLIGNCTTECENALANVGDPKYDVSERTPGNAEQYPELSNEAEAAAWMECVWDRAPEGSTSEDQGCKDLDATVGYCAPTQF